MSFSTKDILTDLRAVVSVSADEGKAENVRIGKQLQDKESGSLRQ